MPPVVDRLMRRAARPLMPKQREEQSRLRKRLGYAGIYAPSAMHIFVGAKIVLLIAGVLGGLMIGTSLDNGLLAAWLACSLGLAGFAAPGVWLSRRIQTPPDHPAVFAARCA